jgi:hypothetical protein
MSRIEQISPIAAFLNALVSIVTLFVAVVLIGPAAMADRKLLMELAAHSPAPLVVQDWLKFVAAALTLVLIGALHIRLVTANPRVVLVATVFGLISVACLLANATLSLTAISQAARWAQEQPERGARVNTMIGEMGLAAILANGPWYLLVNWSALKSQRLPKALCWLGLAMAALSFVPILGAVILVLSIVWSAGLGTVFLKDKTPAGTSDPIGATHNQR